MTAPPPAEKAGLIDDFLEIFTSPAKVFERRKGGDFFAPLAILTVLAGIVIVASMGPISTLMDAEWPRIVARAIAQNPQVTPAQMEQGRSMMAKVIPVIGTLSVPIAMICGGLILWLAGKLFGSVATVKDAMMVATWSWVPRVLQLIVVLVIMLLMDPAHMTGLFAPSVSVAHFLDPDSTPYKLLVFASRVDVFVIWQTVLLGIGLSVVGKIPRAQAYMAAALTWLIGSGIATMMQR